MVEGQLQDQINSQADYTFKYGQRISRLETEVRNLDSKIDGIALAVKDIATGLNHMQRAPWQTMIAAGTFIVILMTVIGGLSLQPMRQKMIEQDKMIYSFQDTQFKHMVNQSYQDGVYQTKLDMLKKEIESK